MAKKKQKVERRVQDDRRKKEIKNFPDDKRQRLRRKEDVEDLKAYYYTLGFISFIIFGLGVVSYIYG